MSSLTSVTRCSWRRFSHVAHASCKTTRITPKLIASLKPAQSEVFFSLNFRFNRPRFSATTTSSTASTGSEPPKSTPLSSPDFPKKLPNRNAISLILFIVTGIGIYVYFKNEKLKIEERKREERATKSVGKVKIGGPFELINVKTGKPFTEKDLLEKFSLIYFGFTNCPDICPEELDKMCSVINRLADENIKIPIQPIFISVDPNRDTPDAIGKYLEEFDPKLIGLTGTYDSIKQMCKVYRVYFSTPPNVKPGDDYLVDHSIFFYLMAPNGNFVDAFGKIFDKDEVYTKVHSYMMEWSKGKRFGEEAI